MNKPTISLCMIAKNEEQNLANCLRSIAGYVDEIIVVDTGSSDRTREVAREFGARVHDFTRAEHPDAFFDDTEEECRKFGAPPPYSGEETFADFGAARNVSFDLATKDFVVWADADDVVEKPELFRQLVAEMIGRKVDVAFLPYSYARDEQGRVFYRQWRERIVRRGGSRWHNRVHEVMMPTSPTLGAAGRWEFPLYVHQRKADRKQTPNRNYKILLRDVWLQKRKDPNAAIDPRTLFYLGQEARFIEPQRAVGFYEEYLARSMWSEERGAAHMAVGQLLEMGALPLPREQLLAQAEREYATAAAEHPDNPDGLYGLARIAYYRQRWGDCCMYTERAMRVGNTDTMLGTNPMERLYRPHAYYNHALASVGRLEEAIKSCEAALAAAPEDPGVPFGAPGMVKHNLEFYRAELARRAAGPDPKEKLVASFSKNEDVDAPPIASIPRDIQVIWSMQLWKQIVATGDLQRALHFLAVLPEGAKEDPVYALMVASTERRIAGGKVAAQPVPAVPERFPEPARGCLKVCFFLGAGPEPWDPTTPNARGLGGSETAAIEMARHLASMGHSVEVVAEARGVFDRVRYTHHGDFRGVDCDVFISSRLPWAATQYAVKARAKLLWVHDINVGPPSPDLERWLYAYDRVLCLSRWHRDFFLSCYPTLHPDRVVVTRNGIEPSRFLGGMPLGKTKVKPPPKRNHLVWSSSPNRGLELLLKNFPLLRRRVPDAELHVYYGFDTWETFARQRGDIREIAEIERLKALLPPVGQERDGVHFHGKSSQKAIADAFMRAKVWPYLSQFTETSCISAMEAMAAACVPVGSACAALPETVGRHGFLFPNEDPATPQKWFDKVLEMLTDEQARQKVAIPAREHALHHLGWREVAIEWNKMLREVVSGDEAMPAWNRGVA